MQAGGVRHVPWHEQANRPCGQTAQQLGVSLEEQPELHRGPVRHEVQEDVRLAIAADPNGQLVREVTHRLLVRRAERERWQIVPRDGLAGEEGDLLPLSREPGEVAVSQDRIEDHQPFDRARERHWSTKAIVGLANGGVEGLVMDMEQARAAVGTGLRGDETTRFQRLEERPHRLAILDARVRAVLAAEADACVGHHRHEEPSLALREAETPDGCHSLGVRHRGRLFASADPRHTSSSARPGSKRLPRPVRPPARAPMARNRVKPARTLLAA